MSSKEMASGDVPPQGPQYILEDGSIDTDAIDKDFGIGSAEGRRKIDTGIPGQSGDVYEMLAKCAFISRGVRAAFIKDGPDGVQKQFQILTAYDPTFDPTITAESRARYETEVRANTEKKNPERETQQNTGGQIYPPLQQQSL